jgi:hypothetical protein
MQYIEPIVASLAGVVPPAAHSRLKRALAIVIGTEAPITVRDVRRPSAPEPATDGPA